MRIGVLTSGGDCPGLNAMIRGAVLAGHSLAGAEFLGLRYGWQGLLDGHAIPLTPATVRAIGGVGGTILGSSRTNPLATVDGLAAVRTTVRNLRLDAVLAVGGEGTLTVAKVLCDAGLHIVGVPKTIDNDIGATDYSFGFNTAVEIATEAIDRLHTTAQSHRRCMVVEVMGRHVGWIALHAGIAGGAHVILVPEKTIGTAVMLQRIRQVHDRGEAPIVVVAEGFIPEHEDGPLVRDKVDAFDRPLLGGVGEALAHSIQKETAIETRAVVIGHIQRGGTPSAYDRVLASRLGVAAVQAALNGRWGDMVALSGRNIVTVPIANAISGLNVVPIARMEEAEWLLG